MRILVLEDDPPLRDAYLRRLRADGHAVDACATIQSTREALRDVDYDCLVLDRRVADGDSLELVVDLRAEDAQRPTLIVSGLGSPAERVQGLQAGADDYVSKPVSLDELALRVRKLLVRTPTATTQPSVQVGRVGVHPARGQADIDGTVVALTPTQFALLAHLATRVGEVVPASELIASCIDRVRVEGTNPLPPHISRLRRAFAGVLDVVSVREQGYLLRVHHQPS